MQRASVLKRLYSTTTAPTKRSVVINGAGLSGLTCALTLQKNGITPKLFDIAPNYNHFKGQGMILPPNAMKVFASLGIAEQIEKQGKIIKKHIVSSHSGQVHGVLDYDKLYSSHPYHAVGIDKFKLIKVLESNFKGNIYFGEEVRGAKLIATGDKKNVHVTLRSPFHSNKYDVLIGADGVASRVRGLVIENINVKRRFPGWGVYSAVCEKPGFVESDLSVESWGQAKRFFIVPMSETEFYVYGTFNSKLPAESLVGGKKNSNDFVNGFSYFRGWGIPKILENIKSKDSNVFYPAEIKVDSWVGLENRAIVIGSAAHSFAPNNFQDVAMDAEDGYVLGSLLALPNLTTEQAVDAAFKLRKPRVDERHVDSFRTGAAGQMDPMVMARVRLVLRDALLRWQKGSGSQLRLMKKLCKYDPESYVKALSDTK